METAINREERNWAMACHLSALTAIFSGIGMIVGPLVVWLIKKDEMPLVDDQGKEALNFQITMMIALLATTPLVFVVIGLLLIPLICLFDLVMVIIASIRAADGERFRYPLTLRLIR